MPLMIPHATLSLSLESADFGWQNRSAIFFMHKPSKSGIGVIVAAATGTTAKVKDTKYFNPNLESWTKFILPKIRNPNLQNSKLYIDEPENRDLVYEKNFHISQYSINDIEQKYKLKHCFHTPNGLHYGTFKAFL